MATVFKILATLMACLFAAAVSAQDIDPDVIYGSDDRMEPYAVSSPTLLAVADASVVLMDDLLVTPAAGGGFDIDSFAFGTFGSFEGLCPSEPFFDQPVPVFCSGVKVGPDLVATAGHCMNTLLECQITTVVFDFEMLGPGVPPTHVDDDDVYFCTSIVTTINAGTLDYAIIRVDRPITGHPAIPIRRGGTLEADADVAGLFNVSSPGGLPTKIIGGPTPIGVTGLSGATVKASLPVYFHSNLDVFAGSSGSVVFSVDDQGGLLFAEGILVRGNEDFVFNGTCFETRLCPDATGCVPFGWEQSTRTMFFESFVPALCGNGQLDLGEDCDGGPGCTGACGLDTDGDGVADAGDNCPFVPNGSAEALGQPTWGDQAESTQYPGVGCACLCGDPNRDCLINVGDAPEAQRAGLFPPLAPLSPFFEIAFCDLNGDTLCNVGDSPEMQRAGLLPALPPLSAGFDVTGCSGYSGP